MIRFYDKFHGTIWCQFIYIMAPNSPMEFIIKKKYIEIDVFLLRESGRGLIKI